MKRLLSVFVVLMSLLALQACTRVPTGEVGLRVNWDKTIDLKERLPGSINQTLIGDVILFKVQEVAANVPDINAIDAENVKLADLDVVIMYNVNPASVGELYTTKSKAFNTVAGDEILLMNKYIERIGANAATKAVRKYKSLEVQDNLKAVEKEIHNLVAENLKEEKLDTSIMVGQVVVKSLKLNDSVLASAAKLVTAQNENRTKDIEIDTARKEASRIAALNNNPKAIEYMDAQSRAMLAEAVKNGKVSTMIVPFDFKGLIGAK